MNKEMNKDASEMNKEDVSVGTLRRASGQRSRTVGRLCSAIS